VKQTRFLSEEEIGRLYAACRETLTEWTERLTAEIGEFIDECGLPQTAKRPPRRRRAAS
jgi:hypothetical protein